MGKREHEGKISIVLPAYQEAENLENILPSINEVMKDYEYEILIIDTMTPMDDTPSICEKNGATYINRSGGNTYGDAIRTGFSKATGKYVVIMDADGSHDPRDILRMREKMGNDEYDLIIGSRYIKGGNTENPFILKAMSWILNLTYRVMFGLKVKDVSDSYRMYHKALLNKLELSCSNFDIVEEILIKLSLMVKPFRVYEVPIFFDKRAAGKSKRDLVKFIFSYISTMKRLMTIKKNAKKL